MRTALIVAAGVILAVAGVIIGLWWAPFVIGAVLGAGLPRVRVAVPAGAAAGVVAWLVPLGLLQLDYGLAPTAGALAAILGFGHTGAVPVVLTLVVGMLLGACGAWLAGAARLLLRPASR